MWLYRGFHKLPAKYEIKRQLLVLNAQITSLSRLKCNLFSVSKSLNIKKKKKRKRAEWRTGSWWLIRMQMCSGLWFCMPLSVAITGRKSHRCDSFRETWHLGDNRSVFLLVVVQLFVGVEPSHAHSGAIWAAEQASSCPPARLWWWGGEKKEVEYEHVIETHIKVVLSFKCVSVDPHVSFCDAIFEMRKYYVSCWLIMISLSGKHSRKHKVRWGGDRQRLCGQS